MASILNIDTATRICSAALSEDGFCVAQKLDIEGKNHGKLIAGFVGELMNEAKQRNRKIDAIAISCGPGSYTGLRIGSSFAKGLCYGLDIPLIAIPTLKLIAKGFIEKQGFVDGLLCPMIDARRMEVYAALYNPDLSEHRETSADIIDENSYAEYLNSGKVYFFGDGSEKCQTSVLHKNAILVNDIIPLSENMESLSEAAYKSSDFKDIAYFEPFYLKEFISTKPKNKVF